MKSKKNNLGMDKDSVDTSIEKDNDRLERRCPRLGGPVTFGYCRTCGDLQQPCWKVFDCWWEFFDVVAYLKAQLPSDVFDRLVQARPKPKVTSLIEMIQEARKRTGG